MSFENNIKMWVEYDNLIRAHNDKIKTLREKKRFIENKLHTESLEQQKRPIVKISDGTLRFSKVSTQQQLSYKLIEQSLKTIIPNEEQVERIIQCIKENRNSQEIQVIKRNYE